MPSTPSNLHARVRSGTKTTPTPALGNSGKTAAPAESPSVQIMIIDDHSIVRRGVRALLEAHPGWRVCGEAGNASDGIAKAKSLKPDVVVMDVQMPGMSGVEATRQIAKALPKTGVLVLSIHESEELVRELLEAGARGYVFKSDLDTNLVAGVEALQKGQTYFSSPAGEFILSNYLKDPIQAKRKFTSPEDKLTARQREVVRLVVQGKANKEVAHILNISVKTAETHRIRAMRKLGLHSLSDLVRYAVRQKIVDL